MSTETKILGIILIITAALLFGGVFFLSRGSSNAPQAIEGASSVQIDYSKGQKIGSDSAKVKVVEFSDFQCPACLTAEPSVRKLRDTYSSSNQIQLIYRNFPLTQHVHSREAVTLAEVAAQQDKFWEMHDKLFETQTQWSALADVTPFFLDLAKQLGLDQDKVKKALAENTFKAKIDADLADGERLGVNSTPTFFLNGHKLNLQSFADLNTAVSQELKKN